MLVLTRKLQQQIQIGPNITITILNVKGQAVSVGIQAPRDVRIIRGELTQPATKPEEHDIFISRESRDEVRQRLARELANRRFSLPASDRGVIDELRGTNVHDPCKDSGPLGDFMTRRRG